MADVRYISLILLFINTLLYTACSSTVQTALDLDLHPFIKVGSKYYLVNHVLELDWYAAVHYCRSYDSDLLTIESETEKDALFSHLKSMFSFIRAWTSSNDLSAEGKYMSLNSGRPMLYHFWGKNEPNNAGDAEDCVEVVLHNDSFAMNDNNCSKHMNVICEKRLPLNTRNSGENEISNCEKVTGNCALKKLVEVYLQTANIFNCRA